MEKSIYTFANLLADLQKLNPEQLEQEAWAWGEHPVMALTGVEVAKEDFVAEDGGAWPINDFINGDEAEGDEDVYVKKGTVWLCTESR